MSTLFLHSANPTDTEKIGRAIASAMMPGCVAALIGTLGAGKTALVKGIATGLGFPDDLVTSPTFTMINEYDTDPPLYHFDFYRLDDAAQLTQIGAEEYFWGDGICVVEWADLFPGSIPEESVTIRIEKTGDHERNMRIDIPPQAFFVTEKLCDTLKREKISVRMIDRFEPDNDNDASRN